MPEIVVGHDGSQPAEESLREACVLAAALGTGLLVVRAYSLRNSPWPSEVPFGYVPTAAELLKHVTEALTRQVSEIAADFPGLQVRVEAREGTPAGVLLELSKQARMLVVGSRGLGGFPKLLLGSTSEQVVRHASCPVLVVRH